MDKNALRKALIRQRLDMPLPAFNEAGNKIMQAVAALPEIIQAKNIHCYWPITTRREVNTVPFINTLFENGKRIILPVVLSFSDTISPTGSRMTHRLYTGETNLVTNRWEVREPPESEPFPITELDAVIVPALGIDRHGFRLGYGKGFYDEFLAHCQCPFICPLLSSGLLESVPTLSHDIPVDLVVTEQEVIRFSR